MNMPRTAIVGYTVEPYRQIATTLKDGLESYQPELVLLDPYSMTHEQVVPVLANLNKFPIVILHVRVLLWGTNYVHSRRNFLHFLNRLNTKVILYLDDMPSETFVWHTHIKQMLSLGLRPRPRQRIAIAMATAVEFRNSLMVKYIWRGIAKAANKNKAFIVGCNDLKLTFWQRVNEIKETHSAYLQVLSPQQITDARTPENVAEIRKKYGFDDKDIVLAAISDITTFSGLKTLARSMAYLPAHYKLVICGTMKLPQVPITGHGDAYIDIFNHFFADMKRSEPDADSIMLPNKWLGLTKLFSSINRLCHPYSINQLNLHNLLAFGERSDFLGQLLDEIKLAVPDAVSSKRVFFVKPQGIQHQAQLAAAANACIFPECESGIVNDPLLTLASEVQDNLFLSWTQQHREFLKLQPGRALCFDVGNDIELGQKLQRLDHGYDMQPYALKAEWVKSLSGLCKDLIDSLLKR
ncbi:MAG: hypothetical protein WAO98_06135 [Alphaproteobacteria bacterium]